MTAIEEPANTTTENHSTSTTNGDKLPTEFCPECEEDKRCGKGHLYVIQLKDEIFENYQNKSKKDTCMLAQHRFLSKKGAEIISLWKMEIMLSHQSCMKIENYLKKNSSGLKIEIGNTVPHQSKKYAHISCAIVQI